VTFNTDANNLVPGDTNGTFDIFVHDRQSGTTERINVDSNGNQGNNGAFSSALSADGRYVAFRSQASNLVPGDTNGFEDVFVRDRQNGTTERVSVDSNGNQGNFFSLFQFPAISADGRFVIFISYASNLVPGDANDTWDVFLHDRQNSTTIRVNVDSNGVEANNGSSSFWASINEDGNFAAFGSDADNLVPGDTNGQNDIFVRDIQTGTTERVSVDSNGNEANGYSDAPRLSADGRYVSFYSDANNLVPNDTNGTTDIFVHDRQTGQTERVNIDSSGTQANSYSYGSDISADGKIITFSTSASNLVLGDTNGTWDVFVQDRQASPPSSTLYVATTGTDTGNCGNLASPCTTISYAITQAVAGNTIEIAAGTYTEPGIIVDKDLTLIGAGATSTIVQAASSPGTATDRVFSINSGVTATIDGMKIQNGKTTGNGGGLNIDFGSTLTLNKSTVSDSSAFAGGGILNYGALTLNNSAVSNNSA